MIKRQFCYQPALCYPRSPSACKEAGNARRAPQPRFGGLGACGRSQCGPQEKRGSEASPLPTQGDAARVGRERAITKKSYSSRHNPRAINKQLYVISREDRTSLLLEPPAAPILGNTCKVHTLVTATVPRLSHQVICRTNTGWEFCRYVPCFCSDLWCSIKVHGTKSICTS